MSIPASDFAKAAVAALAEALEKAGHPASPKELRQLLTSAVNERSGTITVTIATPTGNAGPLGKSVVDAIEQKTGKRVTIEEVKDPSVIGGAVISYGDERIDLSVRRGLEDAEMLLQSSPQ